MDNLPPSPTSPVQTPVDPATQPGTFLLPNQEELTQDPIVKSLQEQMGETLESANPSFLPTTPATTPAAETTSQAVFRSANLTKSYGHGAAYTEVIKGVNFTVSQGEYVVIFGPSGSGKSTLLHLLAGLETPTRGEIFIYEQPIANLKDDELAFYHREEVGLVFQNFNLLDSLTVWENVAFPLMLAGAPLDWRQHEALKMLERFKLEVFSEHFPNQLSGGQQQRVALARALINDPDILLIDEPTGNLDSQAADIVIAEIDRLHKQENRTIILVTHNQIFLPYATRVFYLKDGNLLTSDEHNHLAPS